MSTIAAPTVEVLPAPSEQRGVLWRLVQLYQHDCSEVEGGEVDESGVFGYLDPIGWCGQHAHWAFFVRVDGHLAGFALVSRQADETEMTEFFVLRRHRRRGVGERAAVTLFDQFPGRWRVSQTRHNHDGRRFWNAVIRRYTGGDYAETTRRYGHYPAFTQRFVSPGARVAAILTA